MLCWKQAVTLGIHFWEWRTAGASAPLPHYLDPRSFNVFLLASPHPSVSNTTAQQKTGSGWFWKISVTAALKIFALQLFYGGGVQAHACPQTYLRPPHHNFPCFQTHTGFNKLLGIYWGQNHMSAPHTPKLHGPLPARACRYKCRTFQFGLHFNIQTTHVNTKWG